MYHIIFSISCTYQTFEVVNSLYLCSTLNMQSVKVIKAKDLLWGGETEGAFVDKPDAVTEIEQWFMSDEDADIIAENNAKMMQNDRFKTVVDVYEPRPPKNHDHPEYDKFMPTEPLGLTRHVLDKWAKFSVRHETKHSNIKVYISKSKPETVDPLIRHAIARLYEVKNREVITQRAVWFGPHTFVQFLIVDNVIVTFCTWRALRQLRKIAHYRDAEWQLNQPTEKERIHSISKNSFRREVQGGLLRQEKSPRSRFK